MRQHAASRERPYIPIAQYDIPKRLQNTGPKKTGSRPGQMTNARKMEMQTDQTSAEMHLDMEATYQNVVATLHGYGLEPNEPMTHLWEMHPKPFLKYGTDKSLSYHYRALENALVQKYPFGKRTKKKNHSYSNLLTDFKNISSSSRYLHFKVVQNHDFCPTF